MRNWTASLLTLFGLVPVHISAAESKSPAPKPVVGIDPQAPSFRQRGPALGADDSTQPPRVTDLPSVPKSFWRKSLKYLLTGPVRPILRGNTDDGIAFGARAAVPKVFAGQGSISAKFLYGDRLDQRYRFKVRSGVLGERVRLTLRSGFRVSGNEAFYGFGQGPLSENATGVDPQVMLAKAKYRRDGLQTYLDAEIFLNDTTSLAFTGYHKYTTFRDVGDFAPEQSVSNVFDTARIDGWDTNVHHLIGEVSLIYDSRQNKWCSCSYTNRADGVRGETFLSLGQGVAGRDYRFMRYGLLGQAHVRYGRSPWMLSLRGRMEGVAPLRGQVPFTEYAQLGGGRNLRAFSRGRFRDSVSLYSTVEQHYFPSKYVALTAFAETGRVLPKWADIGDVRPVIDGGFEVKLFLMNNFVGRLSAARSLSGESQIRFVFNSTFTPSGRIRRSRNRR